MVIDYCLRTGDSEYFTLGMGGPEITLYPVYFSKT